MEKLVSDTLRALEGRGFSTHYFESASAMRDFVLQNVPETASVGFGGSVTTEQLGLYDALKARGNAVHFHWKEPRENRAAVFEAARKADVYIMSSNAVSADGALLNIDGTGNRVGSLVNGPNTVFIMPLPAADVQLHCMDGGPPQGRDRPCMRRGLPIGLLTPVRAEKPPEIFLLLFSVK